MPVDSPERAIAAAGWVGLDLSDPQLDSLERYHRWLGNEAVAAGGLGPNELPRIWTRHIADSILFTAGLGATAESCLDLGSGVGLPGIPIAIVRPELSLVLVDRSGRRCDLLRRAIRVLRLANCQVIHQEIGAVENTETSLVSRAALPLREMMFHVKRILVPGQTAVLGLTHHGQPPAIGDVESHGMWLQIIKVPAKILDTEVQLLRIVAT